LTRDDRNFLDLESLLPTLAGSGPEGSLYLIPPAKAGDPWKPLMTVASESGEPPEITATFLKTVRAYADERPMDFNAGVATYLSRVASVPDTGSVSFEAGFNRFDPFYICKIFYVCIFLLAFISWLGWAKPLWRTGMALVVLAIVVHTFGIISRIYISGRPPVTNLYSAAVFIGWGVVVFSIGMEAISEMESDWSPDRSPASCR